MIVGTINIFENKYPIHPMMVGTINIFENKYPTHSVIVGTITYHAIDSLTPAKGFNGGKV